MKYKEKKHKNICPVCGMPNQFIQDRAIEMCQECRSKVIRATYYEDYEYPCSLLNKRIDPVHCHYILDVVYLKMVSSPNKYIDHEFDDIDTAGEICHNCKNRGVEWVEKETRYIPAYE